MISNLTQTEITQLGFHLVTKGLKQGGESLVFFLLYLINYFS